MATKQELEIENIELKRRVTDLEEALRTAPPSNGDPAVANDLQSVLRGEIARLEEELALSDTEISAGLKLIGDLQDEVAELKSTVAETADVQAGAPAYQPEHETMQAWELVEKVKYQYVPADAQVILIKG